MATLFTKIRGLPTSVRPRKHTANSFIFAISLADRAFIFIYFAFVMEISLFEIQLTRQHYAVKSRHKNEFNDEAAALLFLSRVIPSGR